jgi:hypothetical protein
MVTVEQKFIDSARNDNLVQVKKLLSNGINIDAINNVSLNIDSASIIVDKAI